MNKPAFKYVFGPALSRRLGRSLGIDVVTFKTCTYDCIYCQLGPTTVHTLERKPYVPLDAVLDEVRRALESGAQADYITIGGSGEPTLYSEIGPLIAGIKALTAIPVAVITNGSLLWDPAVRDALCRADVVMPSLDAATAAAFAAVNRPVAGIPFERMLDGLAAFRAGYSGRIWLEIFLVAPIDADSPQIDQFMQCLGRIRPDKVHLNTIARPAPGSTAKPVPPDVMLEIARKLGPNAEVIAEYPKVAAQASRPEITEDDVLALLQRHPCSVQDVAAGLSIPVEEARGHVEHLLEQGRLKADYRDGVACYFATGRN